MISLTVSEHAGETVCISSDGKNARKDKDGPVREHKGAVGSEANVRLSAKNNGRWGWEEPHFLVASSLTTNVFHPDGALPSSPFA